MSSNDSKKGIIKEVIGKVKLVGAGIKNKYGYGSGLAKPIDVSPENKVYYPSIHLNAKEAPMLVGKDVGTEVTMIIKAVVTSHSMNESTHGNGNKNEDFTLEIRKIGVVETNNKK